jgi:hypothetical protein
MEEVFIIRYLVSRCIPYCMYTHVSVSITISLDFTNAKRNHQKIKGEKKRKIRMKNYERKNTKGRNRRKSEEVDGRKEQIVGDTEHCEE